MEDKTNKNDQIWKSGQTHTRHLDLVVHLNLNEIDCQTFLYGKSWQKGNETIFKMQLKGQQWNCHLSLSPDEQTSFQNFDQTKEKKPCLFKKRWVQECKTVLANSKRLVFEKVSTILGREEDKQMDNSLRKRRGIANDLTDVGGALDWKWSKKFFC